MKILLVHNYYRFPGGEDVVFSREGALLRSAGHQVVEYIKRNSEVSHDGLWNGVKSGIRTIWAWDSVQEIRRLLREVRPDLVHFHNIFPLISPAAYQICREEEVPVVQSLHNHRILCPAATLYRMGSVCEDCLGRRFAWPAVLHACYHNSRPQTAVVATMNAVHRHLGTWRENVDAYIAFTEYSRGMFVSSGLPAEKIFLKPHFLSTDPGQKLGAGDYALFLGRLVPEKGVLTLLKAWRNLKHIPLQIAGSGPLEEEVCQSLRGNPNVSVHPHLPQSECFRLLKGARFLIWPSEGRSETFGLVAIEAFACGTPVIASRAGAMEELVGDRKTGLHFEAANSEDLAGKVEWAWTHPQEMEALGRGARAEYKAKYTAERNHQLLMEIYRRAQGTAARKAA